jgi:adenosylmethionine-8-amino-7-oxononanoate aminotransferase
VLIIFDEVMTAWGRTGKLFAMDHCVSKPDIVCLSKGLTGGVVPLGLTVATNAIYDAFLSDEKTKALLHGHSFTGNALACAAACASMDLFEKDLTWNSIQQIVRSHESFYSSAKGRKSIKNIRQLGTILAIEIETGEGNTYFSDIRDIAYNFFLEQGMLIRPLGNVIFINPPYCITGEQLERCYTAISEFLTKIEKELIQ